MAKYKNKPIIYEIEAEIYKDGIGLEDGWEVNYTGNIFCYREFFNTKEEALDFIKKDKGRTGNYCYEEDKDYNIDYEDPMPYVMGINGEYNVSEGDYIVKYNDEDITVMDSDTFNEKFELVK